MFCLVLYVVDFFFFKQKTAYEMRISDWSSDVCSSDLPDDIIREMREMGLFGISIPEEYGGLGLSMEEEARVIAELCKASVAFRSVLGTNVGIGSQTDRKSVV